MPQPLSDDLATAMAHNAAASKPKTLADVAGASKQDTQSDYISFSSPTWVMAMHPDGRLLLSVRFRQMSIKEQKRLTRGPRADEHFVKKLTAGSIESHITLTCEQGIELATDANGWLDGVVAAGGHPISEDEVTEDTPDTSDQPLLIWAKNSGPGSPVSFLTVKVPGWWVEQWLDDRGIDYGPVNRAEARQVVAMATQCDDRVYAALVLTATGLYDLDPNGLEIGSKKSTR